MVKEFNHWTFGLVFNHIKLLRIIFHIITTSSTHMNNSHNNRIINLEKLTDVIFGVKTFVLIRKNVFRD